MQEHSRNLVAHITGGQDVCGGQTRVRIVRSCALVVAVTTTKVVPTEVVRCWWCVAEALCTDVWEVVSTPSRKINPTITQGAGCQAARRSKALPATGKQA